MHSGPFMGSAGRSRFEREVQVLGQLDHPNIVRIHDSGVTKDGSCFYVMDYISGKPLDRLMQDGQLPIREALRLFAKICEAVNAAHLKGVIHRDLKPANIRIDKHGEPIVVDFGLAKLAVPDLDVEGEGVGSGRLMSMTGQFIGSLPWASPEQADGSPTNIDVRTDVYSLGVILYQLLTSKFPYEVLGNMRDVLDNIMRAEPARPSTIRRKINDEVETIVLKALAKQRDRRYQSAGELGRDVQRFLEGQPIEAKRDSGLYVISKTLRRYRGPVAVGTSSLVALIVFAVVITVLYREAETARSIAEDKTAVAEGALIAEAEQRQLAENRLDNAYDLAGTMVTEYYDAIRELRGATDAKVALAESAVSTLDGLEAEAAGDPQRLLLIGRGRLRLGRLYAGRGDSHRIGGPSEGLALYERAIESADAVLSIGPTSTAAKWLRADALAAIAHGHRLARDFDSAIDSANRAILTYETAIDGADAAYESLGEIRLARADALLELGGAYVDRSQIAPDNTERDRAYERAESAFERGQRAYEPLRTELTGRAQNRAAMGVGHALIRHGEMLTRRAGLIANDPESSDSALQLLDRSEASLAAAVDELRVLAEADPASGTIVQSRWVAQDARGNAFTMRARVLRASGDAVGAAAANERAIEVLGEAIEQASFAARADESNVMLPRAWAVLLEKRGRALQGLDRAEEAELDLAESIRLREALVQSDRTGQHLNDAAVGWYRMGKLFESRADAAPDGGERAFLQRALSSFENALAFTEQQVDLGISTDNTHMATIQSQIDAVRARLGSG